MNVIAHNLAAMNAQRQFGINTRSKTKSTEKLSSGYKINRAADDAAGLAISEKMRRQIRGLKQGTENIQDGISLVQVADGAIDEITECLQRINELSIKAYNGTNQKTDREYIQSEVDHLISEIQRIADTTTFNEIPVLKGNPTQMVQVEAGKEYEGYATIDYETQVPEWLQVSPTLDIANSAGLAGYTQDITDTTAYAVFQTSPDEYVYYGPVEKPEFESRGYIYQGTWEPKLEDDNACAIIDFSGLDDNVTSASDLYSNLFQLIGTSIGVPCGTCTEYYGISFTGSEMGLEVEDGMIKTSSGSPASDTYLNLSNWKPFPIPDEDMTVFDKVKEMMKNHAMDDSKPDDDKIDEVKNLAADIAERLSEESFQRMKDTMESEGHFNRVLRTTDGRIVIYDFRDTGALSSVSAADSVVQTSAVAKAKVPYSYFEEGEYIELKRPIIIQCSSQINDEIPIDLPLIDNGILGIREYNIAFYTEKTVYSQEYQQKLSEWEKNGCHYETQTITIPETPATTKMVKVPYLDYSRDGEQITSWREIAQTVPAIPERTIQQIILVEDTPRPQPGSGDVHTEYVYEPDDVKAIADALTYINRCRANLGATQNRLEHAYNNNSNVWENTSASESRIRDTDMAKEMVEYSNTNILEQAGVAMMTQANQSNQRVLSLLA